MGRQDLTYAVARIRALETKMFTEEDLNRLLACPTEDDAVEMLMAKGWGNGEDAKDGETILEHELDKTWETVRSLVEDMSTLDVLSYKDLHHNIKSAMKQVASGVDAPETYIDNSFYSADELIEIIREKAWHRFPDFLQKPAAEAYDMLIKTGDGQMLDVMMDRTCLESIYEAGKRSDSEIIKKYACETVGVTDIKIAIRCQRTGKSADFMETALARRPGTGVDVDKLIKAALSGEGAVIEYVEETDYHDGAQALKNSMSEFECWCDNRIIDLIKPELRNSDGIGPIFAYIYARENELKSVRNILMGKRSGLPAEEIRERVRKTYV